MSFFRSQWASLCALWRDGLREELVRSAAAFCILTALSFGICLAIPALLERVMSLVTAWVADTGVLGKSGELSALTLFADNLRVCALCMVYGFVPFIYLSAAVLGINAMLIGALAAYTVRSGTSLAAYAVGLLPHGIFELPALLACVAMGLYLCGQNTRNFQGQEPAAHPIDALTQALRLLAVVIPLLAAAALIEANVTPFLLRTYF